MDTDIDQLLRDAAPTVTIHRDLAPAVEETARQITQLRRPVAMPRRGLAAIAASAAATVIAAVVVGHQGASTSSREAAAEIHSSELALVAAQAPPDLTLPAGVTVSDATAAVLHKITVNPGYTHEAGLQTIADVYRRYAQCQAYVFKPAIGSYVNGVQVTRTDPAPFARLITGGVGAEPLLGPSWVRTRCADGLADPPKHTK